MAAPSTAFVQQFQLMANYNKRLNQQIYVCASELDKETLNTDRGVFFQSLIGTLNHILVGDLLWLRRFAQHFKDFHSLKNLDDYPQAQSLDHILFDDIDQLWQVRKKLDQLIVKWTQHELTAHRLSQDVLYRNSQGEKFQHNFAHLLSHLFNHQTHHRGQASALLSQLNLDVGITDLLLDIPHT